MSGLSTMMSLNSLISGGASLVSGFQSGASFRAQGKYQKDRFEFNSKIADMKAADAVKRGEKAARDIKLTGNRIIGVQRTALAAQGIELDSGSALLIQEDTATQVKLDALTVKNNAYREAWGYKTQALDMNMQGMMAQFAAQTQATSSIITGGLGFASSINKSMYYSGLYKNKPSKPEYGFDTDLMNYAGSNTLA